MYLHDDEAINPNFWGGEGENCSQDIEMKAFTISMHAIKKAIPFSFICLIAFFFIFFITGFIFYTPPKIKPFYDSITIHIERTSEGAFSAVEHQEKTGEEKEREQLSNAAGRLPRLNKKPGKVRVATRYKGLLAQMDSILEDIDIGSVQASEVAGDYQKGLMSRYADDPVDTEMSLGSPIEEIIRARMVVIGDVLEYASSQAGITVDLLAAVAWAESKMLPYAINVQGKAYHFTSRERALKMLRSLETDEVDIGLFQVNYRLWGEPLGLQKEDLLNSRVCALMGALILQYNLQRHRDPWVAIGRYHSGDVHRMRAYQTKVSQGLIIIRTLSLNSRQRRGSELTEMLWKDQRDPVVHKGKYVDS